MWVERAVTDDKVQRIIGELLGGWVGGVMGVEMRRDVG